MGTRLLFAVTHPMTARVLLRGQLAAMREAGFEVGLAVGSGAGIDDVGSREGIAVFSFSMERRVRLVADLRSLVSMSRVIHERQPNIVSAGTPKAGLLGMVAAFLQRVPARVYVLRGLPVETRTGAMKRVLSTSERVAARCAHKVVCVSESLRNRAIELRLVDSEKAVVLGSGSSNGVDVDRFTPVGREGQMVSRKRLGLPVDSRVIGFVGRLTRDKGVVDLAEAFFDSVLPQFPDCRLLLVGGFERGDPVPMETRRRLEDHPSVLNIGFTDEPEKAYAAMDVLAFPSYREGFPNAPLEAAASGLPVVGYAATGTVDAVVDGVTGTLVPVGDRVALADELIRHLGDADLRMSHGQAGRERAVREFRREIVWQNWVDFYRGLLSQRGSREPA